MKTLKRTVSFIDANNHRAIIDVEITTRNKYFEFTASGQYKGSYGQCLDQIKPRTQSQGNLIRWWEKCHLKELKVKNSDDIINRICDNIQQEEKWFQANKTKKEGEEKTLELMEEWGIDEENLEACEAFMKVFGLDELSDFEENYCGVWGDDEDFTIEQCESMGLIDNDLKFPHDCINWEEAASQFMQDYVEENGYYFRDF